MWIAKVKFDEKGTLIGSKAMKHDVNLFVFALSFFYEKDWIVVHITGNILGDKENIKKFIKDLKKEKRVVDFELNGNFFIGTIKEPIYAKYLYNKNIIHVSPALITNKGYEIVNVGSFEKKHLNRFIDLVERKLNGQLLSIQEKKVKSISVMKVAPEITEKQKQAMELAIKKGYYNSPRKTSIQKTSIQELAKISGLSFSTFQVHLRKAEEKLIPYFFE